MYNSIALILGHFVGDYWFQSKEMAIRKSEKGGEGRLFCTLHCFLYSFFVALFVVFGGWEYAYLKDGLNGWSVFVGNSIFAFLIAYITHYPIDRYSFASIWMKWIGQDSFKEIDGELFTTWNDLGDADSTNVKIDKRQYFIAPIYIAIDNSMHLVLMWILFSLLGK